MRSFISQQFKSSLIRAALGSQFTFSPRFGCFFWSVSCIWGGSGEKRWRFLKRLKSGDKMSKMSSSIALLLSILAVASTSDECKRFFILLENYKIDKTLSISFPFRFCPEDIKAAVFRPMVRNCVEMMLFWRGFLRSKKVKYILIRTGVLCINMHLAMLTAVSRVWYRDSCDVKTHDDDDDDIRWKKDWGDDNYIWPK